MTQCIHSPDARDRVGEWLRTRKWIVVLELTIMLLLFAAYFFPFSVLLCHLMFGSLSLWLRRMSWGDLGLRKPPSWGRILLEALFAALVIWIVANLLLLPLFEHLSLVTVDNSRFDEVRGDLPTLLGWLAAVWTIVAFGEEMIFRGYIMNRLADLFGRTRMGWLLSLFGSSLIFGLAHGYQGPIGVISTAVVGFFLGILYLINRRNLWVTIICHGLLDTISLVALYTS